uniref:HTH psq-type domain-containing protein n=1 Tax=Amphilophus citrinellus TaxID=61819 RepID=A0A3Q0T4U6_AMPCI
MPQNYKRKIGRASTPLEDMDRAVKDVEKGKSIHQVARQMNICRMPGYKRTGLASQVFDEHMEKEVVEHIKALAAMFHGLSPMKCRELAFQYAQKNDINNPHNRGYELCQRAGLSIQTLWGAHRLSGHAKGTSVEGDHRGGGGLDETSL